MLPFRVPFENKLLNVITYAYLIATGDDSQDNQVGEIGYLGSKTTARIFWPYGLSGQAPRGSTCVTFAVNGHKQNVVSMPSYPTDRRKNMKEFEFATGNYKTQAETFYDDEGNLNINAPNGNVVILTANKVTATCDVFEVTASTSSTIISPEVTIDGNLNVTGDTVLDGTVMNNGKDIGETHGHTQGNDSANDTQANISGVS